LRRGALNGIISVGLGIPSFIVTLSMLEIGAVSPISPPILKTKYIGSPVEGLSEPIRGLGISPAFLITCSLSS